MSIDGGATFPSVSPDSGELFHIDSTSGGHAIGLYVYSQGAWKRAVLAGEPITDLLPSVVTPGTYTKVTVTEEGFVTDGSNPTTLSAYGITDALSKSGGSKTYHHVNFTGNYSNILVNGNNTFAKLFAYRTSSFLLRFASGSTNTFGIFDVNGTSAGLCSISPDSTAAINFVKSGGGTVSCNYLNVTKVNATPTLTWYAGANSTNGGTNTGWIFAAAPVFVALAACLFFGAFF